MNILFEDLNIFIYYYKLFEANQETIVELIGFAQRVFPELKRQKQPTYTVVPTVELCAPLNEPADQENELATPKMCRTELTFDFHRLNVLLLRGILKDDFVIGKKIATATMSEAKIRATVGKIVTVISL